MRDTEGMESISCHVQNSGSNSVCVNVTRQQEDYWGQESSNEGEVMDRVVGGVSKNAVQ